MKRWRLSLILFGAAFAQPVPLFHNETLNYALNWPSGLSLGEAQIAANRTGPGKWQFMLKVDASVPGFAVVDRFQSTASDNFCSIELEKETQHGPRKSLETTVFDAQSGKATRTSKNGGKSEMTISACARDAVAFFYYLRRELANGRVPPPQTVYFGAPYQVRFEYGGNQRVRVGEELIEADRLVATIKGPASNHSAEIFFQRDAARTPITAKIPLLLGTFTLELAR